MEVFVKGIGVFGKQTPVLGTKDNLRINIMEALSRLAKQTKPNPRNNWKVLLEIPIVLQDWSGDRLHQLAARRDGQLHPVPRLAPPHRGDKVLPPGLRLPLTGRPIREMLALETPLCRLTCCPARSARPRPAGRSSPPWAGPPAHTPQRLVSTGICSKKN